MQKKDMGQLFSKLKENVGNRCLYPYTRLADCILEIRKDIGDTALITPIKTRWS